jgi:osmotically-inducible protein OsmY
MIRHLTAVALFTGWIGAGLLSASAQQATHPTETPEQTKSKPQPPPAGLTADQQSQTKEDLALVQQIRKAIVADKTLSTAAHNCVVITRDGGVTLRGEVNTAKEKTTIGGIATKIAGTGKVTNVLTVKPAQSIQ